MRPAKIQATCPECEHEFEARGQCIRHLPRPKDERSRRRPDNPRISKEDQSWAKAIKERDKHCCRKCGKPVSGGAAHAAHIMSRRYKATRHLLDNGLLLCAGHHLWGHQNPREFEMWLRQEIGEDLYEQLFELAHSTKKRVKRKNVA